MKQHLTTLAFLFLALLNLAQTSAQTAASTQTKLHVTRDLPYAEPADPRRKVDLYAAEGAKNLPVVFWIHGGGWQGGDRTNIQVKPQAFVDKGFVFVSTGYRLLPTWTWAPSFATSPGHSIGCMTTSPSMAATRSGFSSWAIRRARNSPP